LAGPASEEATWSAAVQEFAPQTYRRVHMTRREAADYIATLVDELKSIPEAGQPLVAFAIAKEEPQVESRKD
jgi:hypothetical protein